MQQRTLFLSRFCRGVCLFAVVSSGAECACCSGPKSHHVTLTKKMKERECVPVNAAAHGKECLRVQLVLLSAVCACSGVFLCRQMLSFVDVCTFV